MKLIRFDAGAGARNGIVMGELVVDIEDAGGPRGSMRALIAGGEEVLDRLRRLEDAEASHRLAEVSLLAPIVRPGKYLAIGMNYRKHVEEAERIGVGRRSGNIGSTSRPAASRVRSTRSSRA
jgi:hypothetical protein